MTTAAGDVARTATTSAVQPASAPVSPAECALEALRRLRGLVPFDGASVLLMDPVTHLFTTGAVDGLPQSCCHPYFGFEVSDHPRTFRRMVLDGVRSSRIDAVSDPHDPLVAGVLAPHGYGPEVRVVCTDAQTAWGGVTLWRSAGERPFTLAEEERLARCAEPLGAQLRAAVIASLAAPVSLGGGGAPVGAGSPLGVLVLQDGMVVESSPDAAHTLQELGHPCPTEYRHVEHLRALAAGQVPFTTVLRTARGWLTAHGSRLGPDRVVITLNAAGPERLLGARVAAAGLSARELEVAQLLCRGMSDREIARGLDISEHTAHDHVRSVRRKLGVRSRAEVPATIFAEHYLAGFIASAAINHAR